MFNFKVGNVFHFFQQGKNNSKKKKKERPLAEETEENLNEELESRAAPVQSEDIEKILVDLKSDESIKKLGIRFEKKAMNQQTYVLFIDESGRCLRSVSEPELLQMWKNRKSIEQRGKILDQKF